MIFMVKETSVFTVIAVPELTNTARDLIGMYYRSDEYLLELVIATQSFLSRCPSSSHCWKGGPSWYFRR